MRMNSRSGGLCALAALVAAAGMTNAVRATDTVGDVFVIAMENHNFTQPSTDTSAPQQIFGNPNAPFQNALVTPGNPLAAQTSFATQYHNVLATPTGANPSIHPSEPNYLWMEGGTNYGVLNDNDPFQATGGTEQSTTQHLSRLIADSGQTWRSYQEDTDVDAAGHVLPQSQWTVPLASHSGTFTTVANPTNGSRQFNYAAKHNPQVFFQDTSGGNDSTTANSQRLNYAPLQQLQTDLNNNTVANYNWITPNQYNDSHSTLSGGYQGLTGDAAAIKQGDDFLAAVVPMIMASQAYQNNGAIMIWWDETEGTNANDYNHTLEFILISPLARGNAYSNAIDYTHSSTLRTLQDIFGVNNVFLGDAANATDLSDLFKAGVTNVPAPTGAAVLGLGALAAGRRRRSK